MVLQTVLSLARRPPLPGSLRIIAARSGEDGRFNLRRLGRIPIPQRPTAPQTLWIQGHVLHHRGILLPHQQERLHDLGTNSNTSR